MLRGEAAASEVGWRGAEGRDKIQPVPAVNGTMCSVASVGKSYEHGAISGWGCFHSPGTTGLTPYGTVPTLEGWRPFNLDSHIYCAVSPFWAPDCTLELIGGHFIAQT